MTLLKDRQPTEQTILTFLILVILSTKTSKNSTNKSQETLLFSKNWEIVDLKQWLMLSYSIIIIEPLLYQQYNTYFKCHRKNLNLPF